MVAKDGTAPVMLVEALACFEGCADFRNSYSYELIDSMHSRNANVRDMSESGVLGLRRSLFLGSLRNL